MKTAASAARSRSASAKTTTGFLPPSSKWTRFSVGAGATLNSVAAVVLGGVALTGGTGNVLGVVATAVILIMFNPILIAMGINSNNAQVIQGVLIAGVMMVGGLVTLFKERRS